MNLPHIVEEEHEASTAVTDNKEITEDKTEEAKEAQVVEEKSENVENTNEKVVDKNTQKVLKSLSNGAKKGKK